MVDDSKNIERRIRMIKMADFFRSKRRMVIVTGILCVAILCGVLLTNALTKQTSFEIGEYVFKVPSDWKVKSINAPDNSIGELSFEKDNNSIGGVQILGYEPDQPLFLPNHSITKSKKDIKGLVTKAVLVNLDFQPSAKVNLMKNENHLFLIFENQRTAYDIYANTKYVSESELIKIGKSFKHIKTKETKEYNAEVLLKYKTAYVGDNSKVVNLISSLPYAGLRREVSLKTKEKPYGITVNYDIGTTVTDIGQNETTLRNNAAVMFALIDNVDFIDFNLKISDEKKNYQYTRTQLQQSFDKDLREYAKDVKTFEILLNSFVLRLFAYPGKYALTMSSTPGIRISMQYNGIADKVQYTTAYGRLLTWDSTTGKINEYGQKVELPFATPVYWSPLGNASIKNADKISVKAVVLNKNVKMAEKQINIKFDGSMYYTVEPLPDVIIAEAEQLQSQKPKSIDEAVSLAIKAQRKNYGLGEVSTEGHVILDTEEKDGKVKVYTISSYGAFGFENGIFTKVSGSGAIPTVMTFSKNEKDEYSLLEYKEPLDGAGYIDSTKKMFPKRLWDKVLSTNKYPELAKQQEEQAAVYLRSIGRNARIDKNVERKLADINVEASNKLFSELTKYDKFLNNCPYWLGTREQIEDGARYIYETSQSKTSDGFDLITFRKTKPDGTVVEECKYKIIGNEPQLISPDGSNQKLTAFKGLELYIWKDKSITGDDNVRYNLLPGTNRNKEKSEIFDVKSSAVDFKTIEGTLNKYADGEYLMVKIYNKIDKTELKELYNFLQETKLKLIMDEN